MHRLKVAMSGTSKAVSKLPPNPFWAHAESQFQELAPAVLAVEEALASTVGAWTHLAESVKTFAMAVRAVPAHDSAGSEPTFPGLTAELESQVADSGAMLNGIDRIYEAHRLLAVYCDKVRMLQESLREHNKAVTEAEYYRDKVDKVRDAHTRRKKVTDADIEKLKRNQEKLKSCDEKVVNTERQFIEGVEFLLRNKSIVFDRVVIGYIVSQSTLMDRNPFRGLSHNVQADFSTTLSSRLDAIDLHATLPGKSASLAVIPDAPPASYPSPIPAPGANETPAAAPGHPPTESPSAPSNSIYSTAPSYPPVYPTPQNHYAFQGSPEPSAPPFSYPFPDASMMPHRTQPVPSPQNSGSVSLSTSDLGPTAPPASP